MKLTVDVSSADVYAVIKALNSALDADAIADEGAAIILNRIRTRFLGEQGPDGPWVPSKAGLKRKSGGYTYRDGKAYTGTGTLFETGKLFHSLQAVRTDEGERSIQTDVPYARYAQAGGKRVFLGFNDDDIHVVERLIMTRLKGVVS